MLSFRDSRPLNFLPLDMATLAEQMQLSPPVYLSKMIGFLNPPTAVQFNIVGLPESSGIAAGGTWTLNAQGFWNFTGGVNNSNAITQSWAVSMMLPVGSLWVYASGQVGPNLPLFDNTASWNLTGFDQAIVDLWPQIFGAQSAGARAKLHVSINLEDVFDSIAAWAGAPVTTALVAAAELLGAHGTGYSCPAPESGTGQWECYPNQPPQPPG
jgi:hypothetical protein